MVGNCSIASDLRLISAKPKIFNNFNQKFNLECINEQIAYDFIICTIK